VEAEQFADQAVKFAGEKQLENLVTGGLLELGNSFSGRGDYKKAEEYFKRAIEFARANKGELRMARGRANLGGLYIQTARVDEGLPLVQQALTFFQQGNYQRNVSYCLTQIGRAYRRKGEYEAALQTLNQKLQIAQQSGSQVEIANTYGEIGAVLFDQEKLPAALQQYDNALKIYQGVNNRLRTIVSQVNRSNILWRLGRYEEAKQTLDEIAVVVKQPGADFKQVIATTELIDAQILLSQRDVAQAGKKATEAISLAGTAYPEEAIESKVTLCLIKARAGNGKEAQTLCNEAIKLANEAGMVRLAGQALLAHAEATLQSGDATQALMLASQAQESFARGSQFESQWRAHVIAALANDRLADPAKAAEQRQKAKNILRDVEKDWGSEAFKSYTSRPDIQVYSKELG
jgi:tetratricopeptide (TPR) repeat protein